MSLRNRFSALRKLFSLNGKSSSIGDVGSSSTAIEAAADKQSQVVADMKQAELKKEEGLLKRPSSAMNISLPNAYGVHGYDPNFTMKEFLVDGPVLLKEHIGILAKEMTDSITHDKKALLESGGILLHGETRKEYCFEKAEALKLWRTGCDSDWGQGYSKCELVHTDRQTAIFRGRLSTQIVQDGRVQRAGWAMIKLNDLKAFGRKRFFSRWKSFSHLLIKCRGDGRSYKVVLHSPLTMDVTWGDTFSYPLHTHGGPYWQYEKIPFSRFFHTVYGRIQDRQVRVDLDNASSISIALMDGINGEFSLELDFIGVCHDHTHNEKFAYETYSIPLYNPIGI